MANLVFIGMSRDGYIADRDGELNFPGCVPDPAGDDLGYGEFMECVDAYVVNSAHTKPQSNCACIRSSSTSILTSCSMPGFSA